MRLILATEETDLRLAVQLLLSEEPGVRVIGSASNTRGLLALVKLDNPDLVLLDWDLPGQPLHEVITKIKACKQPPVVVLMSNEASLSSELLQAGVDHNIQKGDPPEKLLEALRPREHRTKQKVHPREDRLDRRRRPIGFTKKQREAHPRKKRLDLRTGLKIRHKFKRRKRNHEHG